MVYMTGVQKYFEYLLMFYMFYEKKFKDLTCFFVDYVESAKSSQLQKWGYPSHYWYYMGAHVELTKSDYQTKMIFSQSSFEYALYVMSVNLPSIDWRVRRGVFGWGAVGKRVRGGYVG